MIQDVAVPVLTLIIVAVPIGLFIFVVDALRRLVCAVEQISKETSRQTEILDTLVRNISAGTTDTRLDA